MTGILEGTEGVRPGGGTDIEKRLDALAAATDAADGRLDDSLVEEARGLVDRARGRLRLSADHTVVGIAGATGSGKSSTFNALTGLELSAVGVRRPTTSWATACVWGAEGAGELLEWLGIPPRHQTTRDSMLDTRREGADLDGVVLLDLPDHDSTEVAHHLEVDRLVRLADVLVWVLDPQKYADAALHTRYLEPLRAQEQIMVVVLNQIDIVPADEREAMVEDVRRLLHQDGLSQVPVIAVSSVEGTGLDELRAEVVGRVADKRSNRARIEADVRQMADRLEQAAGEGDARFTENRAVALRDSLAEAAGVPTVVEAVERSTRVRAARAVGWPPVSWIARTRRERGTRRQLGLGDAATEPADSAPETPAVERAKVDAEVRRTAEDAGAGLAPSWRSAIRGVTTERSEEVCERLDAAVGRVDLGTSRLPGWVRAVRVLQWLLLAVAVAGGVWSIVALVQGSLTDAARTPQLVGVAVPLLMLVGGVVIGIVLALVSRALVAGAARKRAAEADERLRAAVGGVAEDWVVRPLRTELEAHEALRRGVAGAR